MDTSSLLRIVTIGSVDDGKSTLMGRLLYETNSIFEDQYEAIRKTSMKRGYDKIDLSLLLDGLAAEREQAITIDVAYRYFSTKTRNFIVADCPGHEQYTRNMVTGASTADVALLLIDARKGILTQSRRHAYIVSLLGISQIIVVINKMDLVNYSEDSFKNIVNEYTNFSKGLLNTGINFIPASALNGDNVVTPSDKMAWYTGPTILNFLDNVSINETHNLKAFRFPVQNVLRNQDLRCFSGSVVSGKVKEGDTITVLPSGKSAGVKAILTFDGNLKEASEKEAITLTFDKEIDISRGDLIVGSNPQASKTFQALICWMGEVPLVIGAKYILKHTTQSFYVTINKVINKIEIDSMLQLNASNIELNDIALVEVQSSKIIYFDSYRQNKIMGSFILIDHFSNNTSAAGIIQ